MTRPQEEDGVLFFFDNEKLQIIDDKNLPADSLAGRRLKLFIDNEKLFKLKYAMFFFADLVKLNKKGLWFIDSKGKLFQYNKTKYVPLVCKKIESIHPSVGSTIIEVDGFRFKTLFSPLAEQKWAGLLKIDKGHILYGFYDKPFRDTIRKI